MKNSKIAILIGAFILTAGCQSHVEQAQQKLLDILDSTKVIKEETTKLGAALEGEVEKASVAKIDAENNKIKDSATSVLAKDLPNLQDKPSLLDRIGQFLLAWRLPAILIAAGVGLYFLWSSGTLGLIVSTLSGFAGWAKIFFPVKYLNKVKFEAESVASEDANPIDRERVAHQRADVKFDAAYRVLKNSK